MFHRIRSSKLSLYLAAIPPRVSPGSTMCDPLIFDFGPAKAANAGGVAVSGLEQSQNALRISWPRDEVDQRLRGIMRDIHDKCVEWTADQTGAIDYVSGANLAGFVRLAAAMNAYGVV